MKQFISSIFACIILASASFNGYCQSSERSFTDGSTRKYVAVGLAGSSLGTPGLSLYGSYEKGICTLWDSIVVGVGAEAEVGTMYSMLNLSVGGYFKTHYAISNKFDTAFISGIGYGCLGPLYSLTTTVGVEATYRINDKITAFTDICSSNLTSYKSSVRIGILLPF